MTTAHILPRGTWRLAVTLTVALAMMALGLPVGAAPCTGDPTVSIDSSGVQDFEGDVDESGDLGTTTFSFTVTLDCEPLEEVTVAWETSPISASAHPDDPETSEVEEGSDYYPSGSEVVFPELSSEDQPIDVTVYGDTEVEADEMFEVRLSSVTSTSSVDEQPNANIDGSADAAVGTIRNDDVYVSVAEGSATEGDPVGFRVSLTDAAGEPVTSDHPIEVEYKIADGGDSVDAVDDSLTVQPGDSSALILISTTDDDVAESDEEFTLELDSVTNAIFEGGEETLSATGTILDDEPRVWISDVTQAEGHSSHTDFTFEVHVDPPSDEDIVVEYTTVDGDGADGATAKTSPDDSEYDYLPKSDELTFPAGSDDVQTVTVDVKGDTDEEGDETFLVQLSWPEGDEPNVSLDEPGVGTIEGDDNPTVNLLDGHVLEGAAGETPTMDFTVELVNEDGDPQPAGADIILEYSTGEDPDEEASLATPGEDYEPVGEDEDSENGTVTIPAGEATWPLPVTVIGDGVEEDDETFTVTIDEPEGNDNPALTVGADTAVGTIEDDDGTPTITVRDTDKVEGNNSSATRAMEFPVSLSHPSDFEVTFSFHTEDGTAQDADGDYQSRAETGWTIEAGQTETFIPIDILGDTKLEANETLLVQLYDAVNAEFPDDADQIEATGTIINDDGPGISVDDVMVEEGDSGARDTAFQVTADTDDHDGFTVDVATADGSATSDSDYTALETTTLTFEAGETTTTVTVPVHGDTEHEEDETFLLQLSNANFAVIADGEGVATIANDDDAPADDDGDDGDGGDADGGDDGTTGDDGGSTDDGPDLGEVTRSAGVTRTETALQVSRDHWDQARDVVLANAATFPDALAGGTLSALLDAPLLLTFPDQLSDGVAAELDRLGAQTVWILGGPAAVSVHVQQELVDAGYEVHRFFGEDRFATAAEIARGTGPSQAGEVVLTLGAHADPNRAWPDALSAGALAAVPDPLPVLLTRTDSLPEATVSALSDLQATTVYVLGGPVAVSDDVEAQLTGLGYEVIRVAGATRYATSVAAATEALRRHGDTGAEDVVLATGQNFPDGLAAGALAARLNGLLVLVPAGQLAEDTAEFLAAHARRLDRAVIVGGEHAVSANIADESAAALVADG